MKTSMKELLQSKLIQFRSFIENKYKGGYKAVVTAQSGITMIEYILIAALVATIIITLFTTFQSDLNVAWAKVSSALQVGIP